MCIYGTMELYSDRVTIGFWQLIILHRGTRVAGAIFVEIHSCHPGRSFMSLGQGIGGRANPPVSVTYGY